MRLVRHSYSQQGEDIVIDTLLGNKKSGFYVDVWAHDPVRFSNTKRFYDRGWKGINIEPNPLLINKFEKTRKRDTNLNIGISKKNGRLFFYEFLPSTVSTFSEKEKNRCLKEGFKLQSMSKISVRTLKFVLNKYCRSKQIEFLSIDTEGTDLAVLESNNWEKVKPTVICVETNKNNKIAAYLKERGYQLITDNGINSVFCVP